MKNENRTEYISPEMEVIRILTGGVILESNPNIEDPYNPCSDDSHDM